MKYKYSKIQLKAICLCILSVVFNVCISLAESPEHLGSKKGENTLNRLQFEKSPYLLQHKSNPVNWYPWGEEAFRAAKSQDKPIFLSIGYSTCYWCHMMEKDSFEREDVAKLLNDNFIAIKVDREERPDIDKIYMDVVTGMTGHGGWPMSVFLTPDRKPFYGGTFFWRQQFMEVLQGLSRAWKEDRENMSQTAEKVIAFLKDRAKEEATKVELEESILKGALQAATSDFDEQNGGFGSAPKFPPAERLRLLMRIYRRTSSAKALEIVTHTLDKMAYGGIYDHLAGGFHRYSTDAKWLVPHFEKMLYDNALLAFTYLEGFQLTHRQIYSDVAGETLDYILNRMTSEEGGFYSAEDAGEVDKEGEYYVWKESDLRQLLAGDEFKLLADYYNITKDGNFEEKTNILSLKAFAKWQDRKQSALSGVEKKLLAIRDKRKSPHLDDKVLTAWNALVIHSLARGYLVLGEKRYYDAARKAALFIKEKLYDGKRLHRRYRDAEVRYAGYVDDYAFLIQALIELYAADGDAKWYNWALDLQSLQDRLFWDDKRGGYFYADSSDSFLVVRQKEFADNALPSGNGISAINLLKLYSLTYEKKYLDRANTLLSLVSAKVQRYPQAFSSMLIALDYMSDLHKELVVVSREGDKKADFLRTFFFKAYLPNKIFASGRPAKLEDTSVPPLFRGKPLMEDKATIYVCENGHCKLPTTDEKSAMELLRVFKKY